jgi:hypothetical protein
MRRRSARPEDTIQRTIFAHLRERAAPRMVAFHVPNGGKRKPIEAAIMRGLGVTAGVPDVIAIKDGRVFAMELKADGGKMTDTQLAMARDLIGAGAEFACCAGLDAALRQIETWGLVRGQVA